MERSKRIWKEIWNRFHWNIGMSPQLKGIKFNDRDYGSATITEREGQL